VTLLAGARLAASWLTVLPAGSVEVTEGAAARGMALAPLVGLPLGAAAVALSFGLVVASAPALLTGLLVVAGLALVTRGMHLDGLADVADGLGCYGPPERARAVMKEGAAGPFAVLALLVVVGIQAVCLGALAQRGQWLALGLAPVVGRAAFPLACRRGVPAARRDGLGALVAGTQPRGTWLAWWVVLAAVAVLVAPSRAWQGPLAVLVAACLVELVLARSRRRFGGVTGDVLGAACELATTGMLVVTVL
jgi:adenosylcobinamide-GDP ribazoletransferase